MNLNYDLTGRRVNCPAKILTAFTLGLALATPAALAHAQSAGAKLAETNSSPEITQTIFLKNLTQQNEVNDVQTDLRNMLGPHAKVYLAAKQGAISIHGTPEDIELARQLVSELDRPRKSYRLTYTFTEKDGGAPARTQTLAVVAASGERTILKQGSKVPVVTGSYDSDNSKANTQVQYLDVGLTIDTTVEGHGDVLSLHSKVEQSSLADEKSGMGPQDPVVRQSVHETTTTITPGKPLILGTIDILGTTRRQEIAVVAELVK
jgi:type II secretory pathway component GspD/PulD (secretin)